MRDYVKKLREDNTFSPLKTSAILMMVAALVAKFCLLVSFSPVGLSFVLIGFSLMLFVVADLVFMFRKVVCVPEGWYSALLLCVCVLKVVNIHLNDGADVFLFVFLGPIVMALSFFCLLATLWVFSRYGAGEREMRPGLVIPFCLWGLLKVIWNFIPGIKNFVLYLFFAIERQCQLQPQKKEEPVAAERGAVSH